MTTVANILAATTEAGMPTLAPIWLPHWPAWMWTISLMSGLGVGRGGNGGWLARAAESHLGHVTRLPVAPAPARRGPQSQCHSLAASEDSHCQHTAAAEKCGYSNVMTHLQSGGWWS